MTREEPAPDLEDVRAYLDGGKPVSRYRAEERARRWARGAETEELRSGLREAHNEISEAAARELGRRNDREAIELLVREVSLVKRCEAARSARDAASYQYSESGDLGHGAHARALVELDDPSAVPHLLDALERVSNPWVRWEIAWVLGRLGDPAALPALEAELEALEEPDDPDWPYRDREQTLVEAVRRLRRVRRQK